MPAKHIEKQADNIINAKNTTDKKAVAVWRSEPFSGKSDKMPSNFSLPPYHFRCRTELISVLIYEYEKNGVKMNATTAPSEN